VLLTVVMVMVMVGIAVGFKAQQVAAQSQLDRIRSETETSQKLQADLRAEVAEVGSPAKVLEAAEDLGMIEPAPVVAVPAPSAVPLDVEGLAG
jgi:cell division protein FtsL